MAGFVERVINMKIAVIGSGLTGSIVDALRRREINPVGICIEPPGSLVSPVNIPMEYLKMLSPIEEEFLIINTMNKENIPLNPGVDIEKLKQAEFDKQNLMENGLSDRGARRKTERDRKRVGGHGTNFTPKKKRRK